MHGDNLKVILFVFLIAIGCTLWSAHETGADECERNEDYSIVLCGDWTKRELEQVMTYLIEDGEIHKLIKKSENYYLLYTCRERAKDNVCLGGLVHVIERTAGGLIIRPEGWDWLAP